MDTIIEIITEDYDNAQKYNLSYKSIYEKYKLLDERNTNYINDNDDNFFNIYKTLYDYPDNEPTTSEYLTSTSSGIKFSTNSSMNITTGYHHVADISNIKMQSKSI